MKQFCFLWFMICDFMSLECWNRRYITWRFLVPFWLISILNLLLLTTSCFKVLLFLWYFFWLDKWQITQEKKFMKSQNFRDCGEPRRLRHFDFFTNHLKLVKSIPCLGPNQSLSSLLNLWKNHFASKMLGN